MPSPYSGNPANYPTSINLPSGSDPPTAAIFNTAFEGAIDRSSWIAAHGTLADLVDLDPAVTWPAPSSTSGPYVMCWDDTSLAVDSAAGQRWLAGAWDLTNIHIYAGFADSTPWTQVGGNITYSKSPSGICVDSAGNIYVAGYQGITTGQVDIYKRAPGGSFASLATSSVASVTDMQIATDGTNLYYAAGSSVGGGGVFNRVGGGSVSGISAAQWILRGSPTMVLAIPAQAAASPTIYKAVGSTFTTNAIAALSATDVARDLCWSVLLQKWVLIATTGGTGTKVVTSPDGVTWTLQVTLAHPAQPFVNIVAVGPWLVAAMANPSNGTPNWLAVSSDGGVTWSAVPTGTTIASLTASALVASPMQIGSIAMATVNSVVAGATRIGAALGGSPTVLT